MFTNTATLPRNQTSSNKETPPGPKINDLQYPAVPRTAMLLGLDFEKNTYHWEGPLGLPFETVPGKLFGALSGWTRVDHALGTISPEIRVNEPIVYLLDPDREDFHAVDGDETVFVVISRNTGQDLFEIPRNLLFAVRPNPAGPIEVMAFKRSPYALAAFRRGRPTLLIE